MMGNTDIMLYAFTWRSNGQANHHADFKDIRKTGCYYIDKTASISTLVRDGSKSMLFTRPRRFGKTTFQQTLRAFFDIREDNRDIFEGLAIMKFQQSCAMEQPSMAKMWFFTER